MSGDLPSNKRVCEAITTYLIHQCLQAHLVMVRQFDSSVDPSDANVAFFQFRKVSYHLGLWKLNKKRRRDVKHFSKNC